MKIRGMTIIEVMIILAVVGIIAAIFFGPKKAHNTDVTVTPTGQIVEEIRLRDGSRCAVTNKNVTCDWSNGIRER